MAIQSLYSSSISTSFAAERCNRLRQRLESPPPSVSQTPSTDGSSEMLGSLGLTIQGIRDLISRYLKPSAPSQPETKPAQETKSVQATAQPEAKEATYTVRSGDSLSRIARQTLGDGNRWREIYELNKDLIGGDPNRIYPGMVLKLSGKAEEAPQAAPAQPEPKSAPAAKEATYTVRSGDSLSRIAQQTLGDGNRWREIYELNQDVIGSNPNSLRPGMVLKLSGSAPATPPSSNPPDSRLSDPDSYFVSQYKSVSNSAEDTPNNGNCGPTSLTMVALAFKKLSVRPHSADDAIEDTRRRMGASSSQYDGTSYAELQRGAQSYGLDAKVLYGGLDVIRGQLNEGRLVIAHVRPNYLFPNTTSGHYTVVTKIENGKVYLNDPANPKGPMTISESQFLEAQKLRGAYGLISIGG